MVLVADLLADTQLSANYFASDVYVHGTLELGLLENRRGDRLLALPETLIRAIYSGLDNETGQASMLVLYNCGRWWGKNFYTRFCEELTDYHNRPVASLAMAEFIHALQQCWLTHGWGQISLDQTYRSQGFLVLKIRASAFIDYAPKLERPVGFLETGALQSFFSELSGQTLHCVQTACESLGAEENCFVLGLKERLTVAEAGVHQRLSHAEIMNILVGKGRDDLLMDAGM
ncbi:4-vinyl reductase [Leptolyngbya cf. ectocarpi LEGE 11479]|uniref:4-vinyl reductase n=1 Tax=Leptolyngbya cf. ectocarpi LEGE 11479 TaxID=1828722 RepID=A0A928ZVB4_LEPEC|nr:V4R domain-containing protein [Leptolyngbya ectocarpi]MBE9068111.1 4-vinyl reductase [Leptolyngbya cf. ectocarpi LEGE 11479]